MHAAVLTSFDAPPTYGEYPAPVEGQQEGLVVGVLAAGLHHLTRSRANGSHYSTKSVLPLVPGMDGVVRDGAGQLRYAVLDDAKLGTFAERTVIDPRRSFVLPEGIDPVQIAAAMNPGMSSWIALRRRIGFEKGQRVLILGATSNAGRMAVQIAKLLGASQVIAAGRDIARMDALQGLGADETITFDQVDRAGDVDVVLDYVWGEPAGNAMIPLLTARTDRKSPLTWVHIGSLGGLTAPVPGAALRSSQLQIVGSGIGSVPARDILAELPDLALAVAEGSIEVRARAIPLAQIGEMWDAPAQERLVFVP